MKLTVWGCRGSIAAPGKETVRYGGESTCYEILTDSRETIIIDAGSGIRKLGNKLAKDSSRRKLTLLLTHSHWDHLAGFPFFKPAFIPGFTITVCGGNDSPGRVLECLRHQMDPPYFPVDMSAMKAEFAVGCHCSAGTCANVLPEIGPGHRCESIPLNHPDGGFGYKFTGASGDALVVLTDNELRFAHPGGREREAYVEFCRGAKLLIHDAQYTEREYERTLGWGHSTFRDAMDLALDAGARKLVMVHHDPDHTDDDLDRIADECALYLKSRGAALDFELCREGNSYDV